MHRKFNFIFIDVSHFVIAKIYLFIIVIFFSILSKFSVAQNVPTYIVGSENTGNIVYCVRLNLGRALVETLAAGEKILPEGCFALRGAKFTVSQVAPNSRIGIEGTDRVTGERRTIMYQFLEVTLDEKTVYMLFSPSVIRILDRNGRKIDLE